MSAFGGNREQQVEERAHEAGGLARVAPAHRHDLAVHGRRVPQLDRAQEMGLELALDLFGVFKLFARCALGGVEVYDHQLRRRMGALGGD